MEANRAHHICAAGRPLIVSLGDHVELVAELCQALLVWADSAHLPARGLEAQYGRRVRASALIDLAEAFDYIQFPYLWGWERSTGSRCASCGFLIGVDGGPRFLFPVCGESVATEVMLSAGSAVVAGCVHATTLMKLAFLTLVDRT